MDVTQTKAESMVVSPETMAKTDELLGRYSDLIAKGSLDSDECLAFRSQYGGDPELRRLMDTVDRFWRATHPGE